MLKQKVIVSACLLGECCRYDGKTKIDNKVIVFLDRYEIIPFCPEAPLFGTPRERINVVNIEGENRILKDTSNEDVTDLLKDEIERFIEKYPHADAIVLKAKSPSCGNGTTPILNEKKEPIAYGDGIAAKIFKEKYKDILIKDENFF